MPSNGSATTLRISRRNMRHIEKNARPEESVNDTIKRLLKMKKRGVAKGGAKHSHLMVIVKVERCVLNRIVKKARKWEPRDHTLSRLFGIGNDDGNIHERNGSERSEEKRKRPGRSHRRGA